MDLKSRGHNKNRAASSLAELVPLLYREERVNSTIMKNTILTKTYLPHQDPQMG